MYKKKIHLTEELHIHSPLIRIPSVAMLKNKNQLRTHTTHIVWSMVYKVLNTEVLFHGNLQFLGIRVDEMSLSRVYLLFYL